MTFRLDDNPDGLGQRMVKEVPRDKPTNKIDLEHLLALHWDSDVGVTETGWLKGRFVQVTISTKKATIMEIWEV